MVKSRRKIGILVQVCLMGLLLALARPADAVTFGGGSLAFLVDNAQVVVKGRILSVEAKPFTEAGTIIDNFEHRAFVMEPIAVLKGSATAAIPKQLRLEIAEPIWPKEHLAYKKGAAALFFLQERDGQLFAGNNQHAILPALDTTGSTTPAAGKSLAQKIFDELVPVLRGTESATVRARLLVLMSQVAEGTQEGHFTSYLRSSHVWERRAAQAALLRLNPTSARVEQTRKEFQSFYSMPHTDQDKLEFWGLYYEVLEQRFWYKREQLAAAALALLPIYRTMADSQALNPQVSMPYEMTLQGLIRARKREDALRLYRYAKGKDAYQRHTALDALCKLFDIPLERPFVTSYPTTDPLVEKREQEMQEAVREALTRAGLLPVT